MFPLRLVEVWGWLGVTQFECGLCMVSASADRFITDRDTVVEHIHDHGSDDIDLWLTEATEQTTLC